MRGTASAVTTVREANFIVVAAQKGDSMEWIDLMGGGGMHRCNHFVNVTSEVVSKH